MNIDPGPLPPEEDLDPLAEAARAPLGRRLGGAALFITAAVLGIATLRACREPKAPPVPPASESPSPTGC